MKYFSIELSHQSCVINGFLTFFTDFKETKGKNTQQAIDRRQKSSARPNDLLRMFAN